MEVEQIKRRADEHKIIHDVAVKIRELITDAVQQIGDTAADGDDVEELIRELVFD
jgi:predicted RNA-binding Zn ribbon-like protein